jgi:NADH-quinone oxidoreductase subunit H
MRYDQFMQLGWKILIPVNLVWILAVTAIHVLRDRSWPSWEATLVPLAIVLLVVVVPGLMIWEGATANRLADRADEDEEALRLPQTFPTPPLDLVVPTPPRPRLARTGARAGARPDAVAGRARTDRSGDSDGDDTDG